MAQESFYSQFKIDLGDSDRFNSLGELVYAIYTTIHSYNNHRIHTKLKMPPVLYSCQYQLERGECVKWNGYPPKKKYYLGRPEDAFNVVRTLGLGISDANLDKLWVNRNPTSR